MSYEATEQDKVLLDYAQTAQRRADPWAEFQWRFNSVDDIWDDCCDEANPVAGIRNEVIYRRRPKSITLAYEGKTWELPVPLSFDSFDWSYHALNFSNKNDFLQWLAALREIANG